MATVRVGVKRVVKGTGYQPTEIGEPGIEYTQQWVEINGHRFSTDELALLGVEYGIDINRVEKPDPDVEYDQFGPGTIVIRLQSEGFETVDWREEPRATNGN